MSVESARQDQEVARKQAELARRMMLKFNVKFDWSLKRFYCHGCKRLLIPGMNARVRVGGGRKTIRMTCSDCGFINRKVLPAEPALNT